jgi:hypothetical protein
MPSEPDDDFVQTCHAVVYTPSKRRKRFYKKSITTVASAEEAVNKASVVFHTN